LFSKAPEIANDSSPVEEYVPVLGRRPSSVVDANSAQFVFEIPKVSGKRKSTPAAHDHQKKPNGFSYNKKRGLENRVKVNSQNDFPDQREAGTAVCLDAIQLGSEFAITPIKRSKSAWSVKNTR
jgi:hypothetical protein